MARWPVLACLLLTATLLGGCAGSDGRAPDGLDVTAVDLSAPEVGSRHVVLAVNVTLADASQAANGDVVRVKSYDTATGFLVATDEVALREGLPRGRPVEVRVDLPREGSFGLDVQVLHDDEVVAGAHVQVRDLARLQPTLHASGLGIALDFQLAAANATRTDLTASAYLTNEDRDASAPLTLQLKARDLRTRLVADAVWLPVGAIGAGETLQVNGTVNVALGRDYEVEAVLWQDNVVVGRGAGHVALASIVPTASGGAATGSFTGTMTGGAGGLVFDQPTIGDYGGDGEDAESPALGLLGLAAAVVVAGLLLRRRAR